MNRIITLKIRVQSVAPPKAIEDYLIHHHENVLGGLGLGVDKFLSGVEHELELVSVAELNVLTDPPSA